MILAGNGVPILIDFGLAFSQDDAGALTPGQPAGTPVYMSPEQVSGKGHAIGERSDIYSLGVVLYRMLCGVLPFVAGDREKLYRQILEVEADPPSRTDADVPEALERICLRAMARNRAERYDTAGELADDLQEFLASGDGGGTERSGIGHAFFFDESSIIETGASGASVMVDRLDVRACLQDGLEALEGAHYLRARARFETVLEAVGASGTLAASETHVRIGLVHTLLLVEGRHIPRSNVPSHGFSISRRRKTAMRRDGRRWNSRRRWRWPAANASAPSRLPASCSPAARERDVAALFVEGHRVAGLALSMLGDRAAGDTHLEQVIERYEPLRPGVGAAPGVYDAGVVSLACLAMNLQALGYVGASGATALRGSRAGRRNRASAERCIRLCRGGAAPHRMPRLVRRARCDPGASRGSRWAMPSRNGCCAARSLDGFVAAETGDPDEGIVRIQDGLNGLRNVGADGSRPHALLALGRACLLAGEQVQRGLESVDEALSACHERGREHESELLRVRAALLLARGAETGSEAEDLAEDLLMRARETARFQTARLHELRAVLDLAPLRIRAGRSEEARAALDASLQWFAEGESAPELAQARALRARIGKV